MDPATLRATALNLLEMAETRQRSPPRAPRSLPDRLEDTELKSETVAASPRASQLSLVREALPKARSARRAKGAVLADATRHVIAPEPTPNSSTARHEGRAQSRYAD